MSVLIPAYSLKRLRKIGGVLGVKTPPLGNASTRQDTPENDDDVAHSMCKVAPS